MNLVRMVAIAVNLPSIEMVVQNGVGNGLNQAIRGFHGWSMICNLGPFNIWVGVQVGDGKPEPQPK